MRFVEVHRMEDLPERAAARVVTRLDEVLTTEPIATLVLSGGTTPRKLYEVLARDHAKSIEWSRVEFFFGDERVVPPDHPASNYRMAMEALFDPLGIRPARIHRMKGELGIDGRGQAGFKSGVGDYEDELNLFFGKKEGALTFPEFDVLLLGMGTDGHTASLFPGDAALSEGQKSVTGARAPVEPHERLSLTLPVLRSARYTLFLVAGRDKSEAMGRVLFAPSATAPPAALVDALEASVLFMIDTECAAPLGLRVVGP